jgi:hypothetical protein
MGSRRRLTALALLVPVLVAALLLAGGFGSAASGRGASSYFDGGGSGSAVSRRADSAYFERVRAAVVHGAARDFAEGTGIGGPDYASCVETGLGRALDPPTISSLATVYRHPGGSAYAAQVLNALALPAATRCGHRYWVPELTGAAQGLSFSHDTGVAVRGLGVSYGPFLGVRCFRSGARHCARVGIDVVFRRPAKSVVAYVGINHVRLVTPGQHNGVTDHDWVGTFANAHFIPRGRFNIDDEPFYVAVELRVIFAGGRHAQALFPRAMVAPGWG